MVGRAFLDVVRGVVKDEVTIGLFFLLKAISWRYEQRAYFGKTIPIENKRMQELCRRQGHEHPTSPPPRLISEPALILERVVEKFRGLCSRVNGDCQSQLISRIYGESKTCETCANCRGEAGCEGARDSGIATAEWGCILGE